MKGAGFVDIKNHEIKEKKWGCVIGIVPAADEKKDDKKEEIVE